MSIDESLIPEIVNRVRSVIQAERIILFGSAASGRMTRDSDIDLLVLTESPKRTMEVYGTLHTALRGLGFPFDVFLMATEQFEGTKAVVGGIAYPAHHYGRVIYDAA
ncbi:MAG: nucleotidyltransferase domain-containing protein [Bryobacterales bacterium]|nr:nucleotidyltransferase domain-containing protein [Bryobacterales bacterium]